MRDNIDTDEQLRVGLNSLPVPTVSAGFDAAVFAAIRRPTPWWQTAWNDLRPALTGGVCSLGVTLAVVYAVGRGPASTSIPINRITPIVASAPANMDIDAMLRQRQIVASRLYEAMSSTEQAPATKDTKHQSDITPRHACAPTLPVA